jgi:hypothetical protein
MKLTSILIQIFVSHGAAIGATVGGLIERPIPLKMDRPIPYSKRGLLDGWYSLARAGDFLASQIGAMKNSPALGSVQP